MEFHLLDSNKFSHKSADAAEHEYAAVFSVKTPVKDHSGLCHLIEHMVFRGSQKYPCSHELFLINHLLPAKINASTQNGLTFYFVTTPDKALFYQLLDFILQGLVHTDYAESELIFERDGVLHQELSMYEANDDYLLYSSALRGDTSEDNYYHYGGFTDTVSDNTLKDLKAYKQHYYHYKHLSLYLSGPEIDKQYLEKWSKENNRVTEPASCEQLNAKALDIKSSESAELALTWRLDTSFLLSLEAKLELIINHLENKDKAFIDKEVNSKNQIALRVISKTPVRAQEIVSDCLQTLYQDKVADPFQLSKFPQQIRTLLSHALKRESSINDLSSASSGNHLTPAKSHLCPIQSIESSMIDTKPVTFNSSFASSFPELLSIDNIPALPRLFHSFVKAVDSNTQFICEGNHWIYLVEEGSFAALKKAMLTAEFWIPRLSGELYAIGAGRLKNQIFVYGANDKKVSEREEWISDLLI